jgi:hypothetical protein
MSSSDDTHTPIAVGKNCLELGIAYSEVFSEFTEV